MDGNERIVLKAKDINGYLTNEDLKVIEDLKQIYYSNFKSIQNVYEKESMEKLISMYNKIGEVIKQICKENNRIHIYSFEMPHETHGEVSRLISKLRNVETYGHQEYIYYTQRACEMLFNFVWGGRRSEDKTYFLVKTPVNSPFQNYAVHKLPNVDSLIGNTAMCVMLRGALLPSIIVSKEIQEWHSKGYITPFALFKINRNETKKENDMEYILDLKRSCYNPEDLDGKDLIFCDPMNATGGSIIAIMRFLESQNIKPASVKFLNIIAALPGALRTSRAVPDIEVYSLWMDPCLNENAYISPGVGDFGDRLNFKDEKNNPRNMVRLIADYGRDISKLYKAQIGKIENTIFNL
ncbi:MAG: uracil phosphoribosyltransferase [Spirochaetaceae bacterium]|jgi:uracil phosphoribosyltransferase|nr:uracil phosphoribosyltransferase [Spirochaetaceae bacterium]